MFHRTIRIWPALSVLGLLAGGASAPASAQTFCSAPTTADCLYRPANRYGFVKDNSLPPLSYPDASGNQREIYVTLRVPQGAPEPMPVVIWSHGGGSGKTNPDRSLPEWSEVSAAAGYLTISIAHPGRDSASRQGLCTALFGSATGERCSTLKYLNWDRPFDILRVLTKLEEMAGTAQWQGRIDLGRIAVGGHSAGSGGAMSVAGAVRIHNGVTLDFPDYVASNLPGVTYPQPVAFLAFSPQGPGSEGFFETDLNQPDSSWDPVTAPVLTATGAGDNNCDRIYKCEGNKTPYARRAPFDLMPVTHKYRLYIDDSDSYHMAFALAPSRCDPNGPVVAAKCQDFFSWLKATALAFLDTHVRGLAGAEQWLASDNIVNAAGRRQPGVVQWDTK